MLILSKLNSQCYSIQELTQGQWAQDAARIGSLMKGNPKDEDELKDMLFDNLAWLHIEHARQKDPKITFDDLRAEIADLYITHHVSLGHRSFSPLARFSSLQAFDWHNDPFSSGKPRGPP